MRFKDYIVNRAITTSFNNIKDGIVNDTIDNVFISLANKLGYKVIDKKVTKYNYPCENKEWKLILGRYDYNGKRYLEWCMSLKKAVYFDANGILYYGNGKDFTVISPIAEFQLYDKHKEFLNFAKEYYKNTEKVEKEYLLIGYEKGKMYYLCSDGYIYYKNNGKDDYYLVPHEEERSKKYVVNLG